MLFHLARYYLSLNYWYTTSSDSIRKMQIRKFREIFEHARAHSRFYRELYGDHGLSGLTINNFEDINKLPVISKSILRGYTTRDIMTCDIDETIKIHSTSGSTGEPFKVAFNMREDYTAHVRVFWALKKVGYRVTDKIIMIARYSQGDRFDIEKEITKIGWIQNMLHFFRREIISCYEPPEKIISKLMNTDARVLWSTPATVQVLADILREKEIRLGFPIVFLTGEPITPSQKKQFTEYLGDLIVSLYGAMESPSLGYDFGLMDRFTVFPNSNLFQFENVSTNDNGTKTGTVIISNLINKTMPFLRYNLNDYADMEDHPDFGVKYIKRIIGRKDDILDLDTGVRLTELHTYEMFMDFHECETFKFIQRPDKSVVLQLKPAKGVSKADLEKLALERWRKRFGEASLFIEFVDHFKIDPELGKFKNMEKL